MIRMYSVPLIAILTDFGTSDTFVGSIKGVISRIAPSVPIIDLTHEIPLGDIRRAAISLWKVRPYFPQKTVFLSVVDPGVGTSRRPILVQTGEFLYVGPDNGVFTYVLTPQAEIWELRNPKFQLLEPSKTFHGRDIFAPAAAYLACGVRCQDFGQQVFDPVQLPFPRLDSPKPHTLYGEILFSDTFGNLLTSLGRFHFLNGELFLHEPWVPANLPTSFPVANLQLRLPSGSTLPWVDSFTDVPFGECAALLGSSGLLEIVAQRQSAEKILGLKGGETIILEYLEANNG
jgi:S-adenosyl-L-methionine hydrolase (adenosine-forming)